MIVEIESLVRENSVECLNVMDGYLDDDRLSSLDSLMIRIEDVQLKWLSLCTQLINEVNLELLDTIKELQRDIASNNEKFGYTDERSLRCQIGTILEQRIRIKCGFDPQDSLMDMACAYERCQRRRSSSHLWVMTYDEAKKFYQTMKEFFPDQFRLDTSIGYFRKKAEFVRDSRVDGGQLAPYEGISEEELLSRVVGDNEVKIIVDALLLTKDCDEFRGLKILEMVKFDDIHSD